MQILILRYKTKKVANIVNLYFHEVLTKKYCNIVPTKNYFSSISGGDLPFLGDFKYINVNGKVNINELTFFKLFHVMRRRW